MIKSTFKLIHTINKVNVEVTISIKKFSDGAIQCTIPNDSFFTSSKIFLAANIKCSDGIIALTQIKAIIDSTNITKTNVSLLLPFIPYARQDRVMVPGDAFSLKIFTNILNSLNFDVVHVADPHSDVATALIDRCVPTFQSTLVQQVFSDEHDYDYIVSPDGGALKKIYSDAKAINVATIIKADKHRDVFTGEITETTVPDNIEYKDKKVLIIDDILDGGYTYIQLARVLKAKGVRHIDLYITHGIFSKGVDALKDSVDHIYAYYLWEQDLPFDASFVTYTQQF